jgi:hypothetical protein
MVSRVLAATHVTCGAQALAVARVEDRAAATPAT